MKTEIKRGPGRPKLPKSEKRVPVKFRLHPQTVIRLQRRAKAENLSMTKFVGQLIDA